jgi:hypothetical protein
MPKLIQKSVDRVHHARHWDWGANDAATALREKAYQASDYKIDYHAQINIANLLAHRQCL